MVDRFYLKNVSLGCNLEYEKNNTKNEKKKVNSINKKRNKKKKNKKKNNKQTNGLVSARAQAIGKASLDPVNCYKKSSKRSLR